MLSIATSPVGARQRTTALAVVFSLVAACVSLLPFAHVTLAQNPAVLPFLLAIALAADMVTAFLLFSQFLASRTIGACMLGGAYLVAGLGVLAYLVAFPGVVSTAIPPATSVWCWLLWHFSFPVAIIAALSFERRKRMVHDGTEAQRMVAWTVGVVLGIMLPLIALLFVRGGDLPMLLDGSAASLVVRTSIGEFLVVLNLLALGLALAWTGGRTVLQTWLIVALVASALDVQATVSGSERFTVGWYVARIFVVIGSGAVLMAYLEQMHVLFRKLSDLSMIDGLTGIGNRRMFEMRGLDLVRDAHRNNRPLAMLMMDVDFFKRFNDTYGHFAGDECLRAIAATLRATVKRPHDIVARYGGEEFVLILAETHLEGAHQVAERCRQSIADLAIPHRATTVPGERVTVSVGVGTLGDRADTFETLIERADAALYRAKEAGRDRVAIEAGGPSSPHALSLVRESLFEGIETA